jgi:hypothetical protein
MQGRWGVLGLRSPLTDGASGLLDATGGGRSPAFQAPASRWRLTLPVEDSMVRVGIAVALALCVLSAPAWAGDSKKGGQEGGGEGGGDGGEDEKGPESAFADRAKNKSGVDWEAQVQGGLTIASGDVSLQTLSGGMHLSRDDGKNRLRLDASLLTERLTSVTAEDQNGDGLIQESEIHDQTLTRRDQYDIDPRYDRYLTANNAAFLLGFLGADLIVGKQLYVGAQTGYSRRVIKSARQELDAELGYDYTHLQYEFPGTTPLNIHSARAFLGYTVDLTADTNVLASVEGLDNVNDLRVPSSDDRPGGTVGRFHDLRVNGKLALTTTLFGAVSFRAGFSERYDSVPAPLPPFSLPYAPGPVPNVKKLETVIELALVVNFVQ